MESQLMPYMVDDSACTDGINPDTIDVFANDNGSFFPWVIHDSPMFGDAMFYGNMVIYIPGPNFTSTDQFSFTGCDQETSICDSSTVFITLCPITSTTPPSPSTQTPTRATNMLGQPIPVESKGLKILWYDGGYRKVFQE